KLPKDVPAGALEHGSRGGRPSVLGRVRLSRHARRARGPVAAARTMSTTDNKMGSHATKLALLALRAYRAAVSPAIGPVCRYEPACSVYAQQAIERFGVARGLFLAARRVLRCHPFARGGLDPVPEVGRG